MTTRVLSSEVTAYLDKEDRLALELVYEDGDDRADFAMTLEECEELRKLLRSELEPPVTNWCKPCVGWRTGDPSERESYLVSCAGCEDDAVWIDEWDGEMWAYASRAGLAILGWMPLPEPYKEEKR